MREVFIHSTVKQSGLRIDEYASWLTEIVLLIHYRNIVTYLD